MSSKIYRQNFLTWSDYFMAVARLSAQRSKDPNTKVGACIVNAENIIVGIGYNGMPRGCSDELMPWDRGGDDPLKTKYPYVCHAEMNAIMNKNSADVKGCVMYVTRFPCNECAKIVIQSGIKEIIYLLDKHPSSHSVVASKSLFKLAGVLFRDYQPDVHVIYLNFHTEDFELKSNTKTFKQDFLPWCDYFMGMALLSAQRSKDPITKVGACIVNEENKIVAIGYNGMPRGCPDELLPWNEDGDDPLKTKHLYVCHAAMNAIMNKNSADVKGCIMYVTRFPCNECAKIIIQSGIQEIIYLSDEHPSSHDVIASKSLLSLAGVSFRVHQPCVQSIKLTFDTEKICELNLSKGDSHITYQNDM